jgi:hypothetical protein
VDEDDGAIILGSNATDALAIKTYLEEKSILFTVALEQPIPWRVSWKRSDAERPCDWRRNVIIRNPDMRYWTVASGTITHIDDDDTANTVEITNDYPLAGSIIGAHFGFGGVVNGAVIPRLTEVLTLLKTWHMSQPPTLEWTRRGLDFSDELAPGVMVTTVDLALDNTKQIQMTCNANMTGRSWRFKADDLQTGYATDRLMISGGGGITSNAGFNNAGAMLAAMINGAGGGGSQ